jgi:hypothetical protein
MHYKLIKTELDIPNDIPGFKSDLIAIAKTIKDNSNGRIKIVINEADDNTSYEREAHYFLKLDGKRLGNDLYLYGGIMNKMQGEVATLIDVLKEIVIPLTNEVPASYTAAKNLINKTGLKYIDPNDIDTIKKWNSLFNN